MKIRNGFVSNSSSSSFIINYPKRELKLEEVESYFGGYNSDIPTYIQGLMSFVLWKTQYDGAYQASELDRHDCKLYTSYDLDFALKCPRNYSYVHGDEECYDEDNSCRGCKYWQPISEEAYIDKLIEDGYYNPDTKQVLENFKKDCGRIRYLWIDDSKSDEELCLSFSDCCDIREYAGELFKSHDRIIEEKG